MEKSTDRTLTSGGRTLDGKMYPPPFPQATKVVAGDKITMLRLAFWVNAQWRWSCDDAQRIAELMERVSWLERPWWQRIGRKRPGLR